MKWTIDLEPAGSGEKARMILNGEDIGTSRQPIYAAARILLDRGADPLDTLETRRSGQTSMTGVVGTLATRTVSEPDRGSIRTKTFVAEVRFFAETQNV